MASKKEEHNAACLVGNAENQSSEFRRGDVSGLMERMCQLESCGIEGEDKLCINGRPFKRKRRVFIKGG